ncbi:hypothetical protein SAMN04487777_13813 [Priestia aryabhattai B8W22]|nr:hypothetical protein SAMN04487777_13813 [Priestia aryabhattai B8W22]
MYWCFLPFYFHLIMHEIKEREQAQQFFEHFCKMNLITAQELPKPNGALMRI